MEPRCLTRDEVRALDRYAIEVLGVPGVVLMENAGRQAATVVADALRSTGRTAAAILCGAGNNGGDGFVVARHLLRDGLTARVYLAVHPARITGDAKVNCDIWTRLGGEIIPIVEMNQLAAARQQWGGCVIVDALLGTGSSGEVRAPLDQIIAAVNQLPDRFVVAIDVPSGLDCDTGRPARATIRADLTVTFVAPKVGFRAPGAADYTGRVVVADVGVPFADPPR